MGGAGERLPARPWPLVVLDVDGVLAPFGPGGCPPGYADHPLFPGEEPVRLDVRQGAWLRELAETAVLVWGTGWGQGANEVLAPLYGIPPLPVVELPPVPFPPEAKVPAVAAVAGERPVAWVDDAHTDDGRAWAADRAAPTLLLPVAPDRGWTRATVDEAVAFAVRHGGRAAPGRTQPTQH